MARLVLMELSVIQSLRVCLAAMIFFVVPVATPTLAQDRAERSVITAHDLPLSAEYARDVRFRRLQTEVTYIDRLQGEIPMDGRPLPPPAEERPDRDGEPVSRFEGFSQLVLLALAVGAIVLLVRNWTAIRDRLTGAPAIGGRAEDRRAAGGDASTGAPIDGLLARLSGMEDRREALVLLLKAVLNAAARQNDLRLGRSETARELMRRLPRSWRHLDNARHLVMAEELVQFGGRPLPQPLFEDCLRRAAPILADREVA